MGSPAQDRETGRTPDRHADRTVIPLRPADGRPDGGAREPLWRDAVGEALRRARLEQGRTLRDVADDAGISLPYLSELERGRKEASSEVLAAAARALGLRLADLLVLTHRELFLAVRVGSGLATRTGTGTGTGTSAGNAGSAPVASYRGEVRLAA